MKFALPTTEEELDDDLADILGHDTDSPALDSLLMKRKLREVIHDNQLLVEKLNARNKDVRRLCEYIDTLLFNVRAIERSKAWKLGNSVAAVVKTFMRLPHRNRVFTDCERVGEMYHHWKKSLD